MIIRDIKKLNIQTQDKAMLLQELCKKNGYYIYFAETLRTQERQRELICQGRTVSQALTLGVPLPIANKLCTTKKPKVTRLAKSLHQSGIAFDIYFDATRHGQAYPSKKSDIYKQVGKIGKCIGLDRGGDRTVKDCPHFQDNGQKLTNDQYQGLKYQCHNAVGLPIIDDIASQIKYIKSIPQENQISEMVNLINNATIINGVKQITL